MKIAVYTISKNEEQFVERWWRSAKDADYVVLVDTGSSDGTVETARSLGVVVHEIFVSPWRFDDARNAAIALLPRDVDVCVSVDVDEVLSEGWRNALESQWEEHTNRGRYLYTWSHDKDGNPTLTYWYEKIHSRHGFRWKHPVHEILQPDRVQESWVNVEGMEVHHWPDPTKSRGQYLDLLDTAVREDPHNDRNAYYFARELMFNNLNERAAEEFKRHLSLPTATWKSERAASYRGLARVDPDNAEEWLKKACAEVPDEREPALELAEYYYRIADWRKCLRTAQAVLKITNRYGSYLSEARAWGYLPHDLIAISAHYLGDRETAVKHGKIALELEPNDARLVDNMKWYLGKHD